MNRKGFSEFFWVSQEIGSLLSRGKMKGVGRKKAQNDAAGEKGEKEVNMKGIEDESDDGFIDGEENLKKGKEVEGNGEKDEGGEGEDEEEEEGEAGEEEGEGKGVDEGQGPKLDDGFFEIEAIRRKRTRKGQHQYLIKWRGWPETANTWEPLENLLSCSDVIDAFEESLLSGKHNRKRKRKSGTPLVMSKKKQSRSSSGDGVEAGDSDNRLALVPFENSSYSNISASNEDAVAGHVGKNNGTFNSRERANWATENGVANGSKQINTRKRQNEYGIKPYELKGVISPNGIIADNHGTKLQESKGSEGECLANGLPKVDRQETVESNRRTGAKRRKSGSVKRFKQNPGLSEPNLAENSTPNVTVSYGVSDAWIGIGDPIITGENSSYKPKVDHSVNACTITKILKPIGFSSSEAENGQDVSVTFTAMRSDGKEVIVDNKYLKANNPLLLINFYEQHLKYSPMP